MSDALHVVQVEKLKEKMGTRQLPTAELLLDGVRAHRLSETGRGVPSIAPMLTITRIHNAIGSVAAMRRCALFSLSYRSLRYSYRILYSLLYLGGTHSTLNLHSCRSSRYIQLSI